MNLRRPVARINRPRPGPGAPGRPAHGHRLRVGLLGGSFNPAHAGHQALSLEALRRLRLDRVDWLVSPQNPLKPKEGMASFEERFASAASMARHPRLQASDVEQRLGTRYTVETIRRLQRDRRTRYVWLIGADNLVQLPRWRCWREIVARLPIAVFDREPYVYDALAGRLAQAYAWARKPERMVAQIAAMKPPAWVYVRFRRYSVSSTAIRTERAASRRQGGG